MSLMLKPPSWTHLQPKYRTSGIGMKRDHLEDGNEEKHATICIAMSSTVISDLGLISNRIDV